MLKNMVIRLIEAHRKTQTEQGYNMINKTKFSAPKYKIVNYSTSFECYMYTTHTHILNCFHTD